MIDSHAHLDFPDFNKDREEVIARARQQGVDNIITVGTDLSSSRVSLQIARQHPGIFSTIGFHPHNALELHTDDLARMAELAEDARVVAVGEIGLDFFRRLSSRLRQIEAFQQQLALAVELDLPVVIHSRNADKEVYEILSRWVDPVSPLAGNSKKPGVIHCYSGDLELAERYIEMGFLISLPGTVTYPSARDRVAVARQLPLDKLLVETDAPFLAPQLHRGQRNEPSYIPLIVDKIAQIKDISVDTVAKVTTDNAVRLFRLPAG